MKIRSFTHLNTWKEAYILVLLVYKEAKQFPKVELYSLIDQIKRASVSITSNIAEGFSRQSKKEKVQFYFIAKGSITELQNQLIIARGLKYIEEEPFNKIIQHTVIVHKLLNGLIKSAQNKYNSIPYKIPDTKY